MNDVPHIETKALAATLRKLADLLREGLAADAPDVYAAIADAEAQAAALDTIKKQAHIVILGDVPFEIRPGLFPMRDGRLVPFLSIIEESGETFGLGFTTGDSAARVAAHCFVTAMAHSVPPTSTEFEFPPLGKGSKDKH